MSEPNTIKELQPSPAHEKPEEVYLATVQSAWDAYMAAVQPAREAYEATRKSAQEAYEAAKKSAWEVYQAAVQPAREARLDEIETELSLAAMITKIRGRPQHGRYAGQPRRTPQSPQ